MFWLKTHARLRRQLSAYIDGQLSPRQRQKLEAHLAACLACRRQLEGLRAAVAALQGLPLEEAPRTFALSPEQVARPRPTAVSPQPAGLPLRLATAALAFALAVVLVVDLADLRGGGVQPVATSQPAAERAAPATGQQAGEAFGLTPEREREEEAPPLPSPPAADMEAAAAPEAEPREDGGLDPLRAAEVGLAVALAMLLLASAALALRTRRSI